MKQLKLEEAIQRIKRQNVLRQSEVSINLATHNPMNNSEESFVT